MIKIENVSVMGWEPAIRGMRNPMNSWEKSDSVDCHGENCKVCGNCEGEFCSYGVGPNDHDLMMRLGKGGPVHAKYRRFIDVYLDITAPFYWWKEFRTYRHKVKFMDEDRAFEYPDDSIEYHIEMNSCSTMHKIQAKEFEIDDFSHEHLDEYGLACLEMVIQNLNSNRHYFNETKDKDYWWQMIQLLPGSYNQKRTVKLNYEVLSAMYEFRKNHKLDCWRDFCAWIKTLPYSEIITGEDPICKNNGEI